MTFPIIGPTPSGGDDTAAVQAFFDSVVMSSGGGISHGSYGILPAGTFNLNSNNLRIGDSSSNTYGGFRIEGAGRNATVLNLTASGQPSIIDWYGNAARDTYFGDMMLNGSRTNLVPVGLNILSTAVSHLQFNNLHIQNPTLAIKFNTGSVGNGEFVRFSNIQTHGITNFYYTDASQNFKVSFRECFIYYAAGGTLFQINSGVTGNGGGLDLFAVSASITNEGGTGFVGNSVLFDVYSESPIKMVGGRFEWLTSLLRHRGGTEMVLSVDGTEFTTDWRTGKVTPRAFISFEGPSNHAATVVARDARFVATSPDPTLQNLPIDSINPYRGMVHWRDCRFHGYANLPTWTSNVYPSFPVAGGSPVIFDGCSRDGNAF